tara:strand:+ start:29 stop:865 length:837 start_codon:yes stop_codon:yes gene_type:complete
MKTHSIKKIYADALYWASSNLSKDKDYHITRTQEAILRKLIHYSTKKDSITYSNSIISQHTFMGEETIRKNIPELAKKGYISTACMKITDGGQIKTRRTILIKWDFIEKVLADVPKVETTSTETIVEEQQEKVIQMDKPIEQKAIEKSDAKEDTALPRVEITDEKLDWLKRKVKKPTLTKEDLNLLDTDELYKLFYGDDGIWHIDKYSMENQHRIKLVHRGGSIGKLYNNRTHNDRMEVNVGDLDYLFTQSEITFKDFTLDMYKTIKKYGLDKIPKSA